MRRLTYALLVLATATLSACAGSAPVAVRPPPPRPAPQRVRPAPPPAPVAVVVPPAAPAQAPRGTIQTRTYYAEADVTEWVLSNGATVVFKPLPNGGQVAMTGIVPGDPTCDRRMSGLAPAGNLSSLFSASLGSTAVYAVVGDARPGEVEQVAARLLTLAAAEPRCMAEGFSRSVYSVTASAESDAALAVLAELLTRQGHTPVQQRALPTGRFILSGDVSPADLAGLRPSADDLNAARATVAARLAESPEYWMRSLLDLYHTDSTLRPSRDPAFVSRFSARVARVSAESVTALASRFAASPSN